MGDRGIPGVRSVRRLLVVWTLAFWQGGFMFYGGVVIPVGSRILGSDLEQTSEYLKPAHLQSAKTLVG